MDNERIWYPIKDIGTIGKYILNQLKNAEKQYKIFKKAKEKPGSMNNELVNRMKKVLTEQREYITLYEEQVFKWNEEVKNNFEKQEVLKLTQVLKKLSKINQDSLEMADYMSKNTIENIMLTDDIELAIKALTEE
jgi:hypothetical protein